MDDLRDTINWRLLEHELHIEGYRTDTESIDAVLRLAANAIRNLRGQVEDLMYQIDVTPTRR